MYIEVVFRVVDFLIEVKKFGGGSYFRREDEKILVVFLFSRCIIINF